MDSSIQPFNFRGHDVRVVTGDDGEPRWVAADVANILGYRMASDMTRFLEEDEKGTQNVRTPGGEQELTVITESGLYAAVLKSRRPEAVDFRRWVTREVLPAIRRTGSYGAPTALPDRRALAQMVIEAEDRADREALRAQTAEAALESAAPALNYHEKFVAERDDILTVDNWARQAGITGPQARELLAKKNIAFRREVGARWSQTQGQMVTEYEWRPRAGRASTSWFVLRPQHNAPRLHNGQVRQTMYVLAVHADDLARRLGVDQQEEMKETA